MLKAWRTPFEAEKFPSVWATCGASLDDALVFIGFPAVWRIKFEHIVGLKICDETYDNNSRFWIDRDEDGLCSYTWDDSPWLRDFNADYVVGMGGTNVIHYVLLGGDYNVEVLSHGNVDIIHLAGENS